MVRRRERLSFSDESLWPGLPCVEQVIKCDCCGSSVAVIPAPTGNTGLVFPVIIWRYIYLCLVYAWNEMT